MSRPIAAKLTAFGTFVDDDKAAARVGLHTQRHHFAAAVRGAVPGVDVKMKRPQAKGTVVARAIAEGLDLAAAVGADKGGVVLVKRFCSMMIPF